QRVEALPERGQAGGAGGAVGPSVVVAEPRHDLDLGRLLPELPVQASDLVRRVVRLGSARGEEGDLELPWGQLGQARRQPGGGEGAEATVGRAERQPGHLLRGRLGELPPSIADVDVPERRHRVDVLAALDVGQDRSLSMADHQLGHGSGRAAEVALRVQPVCAVQLVEPAYLVSRQHKSFHRPIMSVGEGWTAPWCRGGRPGCALGHADPAGARALGARLDLEGHLLASGEAVEADQSVETVAVEEVLVPVATGYEAEAAL